MNQKERILRRLRMGEVCSMEFLDWQPRITRAAARIEELRDDHQIVSEPCKLHQRKVAQHVKYRLVTQDQGALF